MRREEFKKQEAVAKGQINTIMNPIIALSTQSREEQVAAIKDTLMEVIRQEDLEDSIDQEIAVYGQYAQVKKRLVHLYISGHFTLRQIAVVLGVSVGTISKWLKQDDVREAIQRFQDEEDIIASSMMKSLRIIAINKQRELIEGAENEMVSAIMIRDLLDRTGHKPVEKKQIEVNMTYEERLQKLVEGVEYDVIDVNESDLSRDKTNNTEGDDKSDL